jgi:hypothetical protein
MGRNETERNRAKTIPRKGLSKLILQTINTQVDKDYEILPGSKLITKSEEGSNNW